MSMTIQPGFAIWFTGLPASGKTTLAYALRSKLLDQGISTQILDSDELRHQLTPNPTYSIEERKWFYDMIIFLADLLTSNGVNVLIAATATRRAYREKARRRLACFAEVSVRCSPTVCRERDPKGLWRRADNGEITNLPGVGTTYEWSETAEVEVDTTRFGVDDAVEQVLDQLVQQKFLGQMMVPA